MKFRVLLYILFFSFHIVTAQNGGYYKKWINTYSTVTSFTNSDTPSLSQIYDSFFRTRGFGPFPTVPFNPGGPQNRIFNRDISCISSPQSGRLLFYFSSFGIVYDSTFQPMPNSIANGKINAIRTLCPDCQNPTMTGSLVIPVFNNPNKFILFSLFPTLHLSGLIQVPCDLYYSVIDMSLNNGKGDVVTTQKNILLKSNLWGGPLNAVRNPQNNHFWLLCHDTLSTYFAFDINANGQINATPVSSIIGNHLSNSLSLAVNSNNGQPSIPTISGPQSRGVLKTTIDGSTLALGFQNGFDTLPGVCALTLSPKHYTLEMCTINKTTGSISLLQNLTFASTFNQFEFSPNGSFLYTFDSNRLVQVQLNNNNIKIPILNYNIICNEYPGGWKSPHNINCNNIWVHNLFSLNNLQLAENGRLYVSDTDKFYSNNSTATILFNDSLYASNFCIPYPDLPYPACGFKSNIFFGKEIDMTVLSIINPLSNPNQPLGQGTFPNIINSLLFSPTIVRPWATQISYTTATLNSQSWVANTTNFPITQRGFCYGLSPQPSGNSTPVAPGTGPFSAPIAGLQPNTTYYIRAYATNNLGTFYSADSTFKTQKPNTAPIMSSIANTNFCTADSIAFVVVDSETSPVHMQYSISSSNTALLPLSGLSISGVDTQKQFHFIPTAGQSGTSLITIQAIDSNGLQSSISFTLSVGTLPTLSTQAQGPTTFCLAKVAI